MLTHKCSHKPLQADRNGHLQSPNDCPLALPYKCILGHLKQKKGPKIVGAPILHILQLTSGAPIFDQRYTFIIRACAPNGFIQYV